MSGSRHTRADALRMPLVFLGLLCLLLVVAVANLCLGSVSLTPSELLGALLRSDPGSTAYQVIWSIRLPRLLAAGLLGGALGLAGLLMQVFFNNPIAGPYILGISSGAKLVVATLMVVVAGSAGVLTSWMLVLAAFVGSLASMSLVLAVSRHVRSASTLIVVGVMIGYIASALTDMLVTFASDASIINLRNWSLGSFSGVSWRDVGVMTVVVSAAFLWAFLLSKPLGAYQLGERYARSMGVDVGAFRAKVIVLSSVLSACVTAFAGPISFVGIAVPHLVRRLLGTSRPLLVVPATFLGGAIFCLLCDLIARCAFAPTELSVSTVTAAFGAPVVIWVLLSRRSREEGRL